MTRNSFIVAIVGVALTSVVSSADVGSNHQGEWQMTPTGGGKVGTWVYREVPEEPHALTGTLERSMETKQCRTEWQQWARVPTTVFVCR